MARSPAARAADCKSRRKCRLDVCLIDIDRQTVPDSGPMSAADYDNAVERPTGFVRANAIHAFTGVSLFVAAAQLVFFVTQEPETDRRLLLGVKNNLGPRPCARISLARSRQAGTTAVTFGGQLFMQGN